VKLAYHVLITTATVYADPKIIQLRRLPALTAIKHSYYDSWESPSPTSDQALAKQLWSKLGAEHDDR